MKDDDCLTLEQAFCAMFYFLENEYAMTRSDDIAAILSALDWLLWDAPGPADPAAWEDWLEAVEKMKKSTLFRAKQS